MDGVESKNFSSKNQTTTTSLTTKTTTAAATTSTLTTAATMTLNQNVFEFPTCQLTGSLQMNDY